MSIVRRIPPWRCVPRHVIQGVESYAHTSEPILCLHDYPKEAVRRKVLQGDAEHVYFGTCDALVAVNRSTGLKTHWHMSSGNACAVTSRGEFVFVSRVPHWIQVASPTHGPLWTKGVGDIGCPFDATVTASEAEVWVLFVKHSVTLHAFALRNGTWLREVLPNCLELQRAVLVDTTPSGLICLAVQDRDEDDALVGPARGLVVMHPEGGMLMACRTSFWFEDFGVARGGDTILVSGTKCIHVIRLADGAVVNARASLDSRVVVVSDGIRLQMGRPHTKIIHPHTKIVHTSTGAVVVKFRQRA